LNKTTNNLSYSVQVGYGLNTCQAPTCFRWIQSRRAWCSGWPACRWEWHR